MAKKKPRKPKGDPETLSVTRFDGVHWKEEMARRSS